MTVVFSVFGGEKANIQYLLRNKTALVLRGDPKATQDTINSLDFKQRFFSSCMSFNEELPLATCLAHINEVENATRAGLPEDSIMSLWVRHTDKTRTELHNITVAVDLITGCQMTYYLDRRDRNLFNAIRDVINIRESYTRPDDPARKKMTSIPLRAAQSKKDFMVQLDLQIGNEVAAGRVKNRDDVVRYLEGESLIIKRSKKGKLPLEYLKIKRPQDESFTGLRGAYYRADFTAQKVQSVNAEITIPKEQFLKEAQQRLAVEIERRAHRQRERHEMALRAAERRTKKLAKNVNLTPPSITEIAPILKPRIKPVVEPKQRQEITHDEYRITNPFSTVLAEARSFLSSAGSWFNRTTQTVVRLADGLFQSTEPAAPGAENLGELGSAIDGCCQRLLRAFAKLDRALGGFEDEDGGAGGIKRTTPRRRPPTPPQVSGPKL